MSGMGRQQRNGVNCVTGKGGFNTGYCRGGSRNFFRRGYTRLLLYFNTSKPHSVFFCRIPVVLVNCRSFQRGGGVYPLHPPPRSTPVLEGEICT